MTTALLFLLVAAQVDTDSLRRVQQAAVERERVRIERAGALFLDRARPAAARLAAVRNVAALGDERQISDAVATALDSTEPRAIRVRALQLTGQRAQVDTSFSRRLFALATDRAAPSDLRHQAVTQLSFATFGSEAMHAQAEEFLRTFRAAAQDPDIRTRRVALRALAQQNDSAGLELLRDDLTSPPPEGALLPPAEAVQLLGLVNPAPFYDLLRRLVRSPPNAATRVTAIRLLAADTASRAELVRIVRARGEPLAARQAALAALAAGDPGGLPQHVVPVVADERTPADLRLRAINAVEVLRTSRDPRVVGRAPDEFDRAVERIAQRSAASAVRSAARRYLVRTRSPR